MNSSGDMAAAIRAALEAAFAPRLLEVEDESAAHRGHAGAPAGGQSHFRVRIAAERLDGMSRLARHRAVHAALGPEVMGRIHALALHVEG